MFYVHMWCEVRYWSWNTEIILRVDLQLLTSSHFLMKCVVVWDGMGHQRTDFTKNKRKLTKCSEIHVTIRLETTRQTDGFESDLTLESDQ